MQEELISKRELLATYGISYGTLYRWKRSGLIPDDWFIRKSTETGQETFFPRQLIVDRVNYIMLERDSASLDELAQKLNAPEDEAVLIIETKYGSREFRLLDVTNIKLRGGGREILLGDIFNIKDNV